MEPDFQTKSGEELASFQVEKDLAETLCEAKQAGSNGLQDPHPMVLKTRLAFEHMRDFLKGQLDRMEQSIPDLETELECKHRALNEADRRLLLKWNEQPRLVKDRAEAKAAMDEYSEEMNAPIDRWQFIVSILFLLEFAFGYWIFKTFVLPDPGWGNELTSVLIGAMTVVIGLFVKHLPDSTLNTDKYARSKRLLGVASAISAVAFVILLAALRQTSETLLPDASAGDAAALAPTRAQDFVFQLSILCTLIFSSAFFAHWKKKRPKTLLTAMNREAKDLLAWYDSDEYQHTKLANDVRNIDERIFNMKAQRKLLRERFKSCSQKRLHTVMQQSCLAFIEGTLSLPHTEAKKLAAQNGRKYLDSITVSGLEIVS